MKNNILKGIGTYGFFFSLMFAIFSPICFAQSVNKVKANISATESDTQCKIEYTFKNGTSELKELTASTILFQDTKIANIKASDSSGDLMVSGSPSGGKYSSKIILREPISPGATYSFTLTYDVEGSVKTSNEKKILTVPLLSLPWKSIIPKEPVCSIDATLPPGMNLIRTSPRILSTTKSDSRVTVHTSSSVLVSFFRAEYTKKEGGFFTPENTTNVAFFGTIILLILLWLYYNFVYMKRKNMKGGK